MIVALRPLTIALAAAASLMAGAASARCPAPALPNQRLDSTDVQRGVAQAADVAQRLNQPATIAVVDRVGNVLAVFQTSGAASTVRITSGVSSGGGLEGLVVPSTAAAIAKAVTGAYLSSSGQAFSTRTASFIVQDHFPPTIRNVPSGPLFGVQFSQLPCGDLVQGGSALGIGPRRSPLGLSADPGGFPLYKAGSVVGGIGVIAGSAPTYTVDLFPFDFDNDPEEVIAHSALAGFTPPDCIRAERVTAGGVSLRFSDADGRLQSSSATLPAGGSYVDVGGYYAAADGPRTGRIFGLPESGVARELVNLAGDAHGLLNPDGSNRFPPIASAGLSAADVTSLLDEALGVANAARAQIRIPLGSPAQVTVSVVDAQGVTLGVGRTPDAPIFGIDVSLQKARAAALFSRNDAAARIATANSAAQQAFYFNGDPRAAVAFFQRPTIFADGTAFTARAIGNIARPLFPDGIEGRSRGPLSSAKPNWSPFNVGLQLDLVFPGLAASLAPGGPIVNRCTATAIGADNGIQIFPGGVPIYRNGVLVGAVGVSGDGVDQDDMIAFLGITRAARWRGGGLGHAPLARRSDTLGLRYVQCPQSPFNGSDAQNVCGGDGDLPTTSAGPVTSSQPSVPERLRRDARHDPRLRQFVPLPRATTERRR
ncbi:MAG: heme-binding protein [Silanimonas sp.]